jgi:DNA polymerase-3 subunit beta
MKTVLQAGALADALDFISDALATSAHIPVLAGARLEASASGLTVSVTDFERYATATVAGAVVEHCGAAVLSATALTGIAEGFAKDATMTITADEKSASVQSGRSRYRPPVWPITDFPLPLAIDAPVCSATMGRHELRNLFGRTAFAASTEPTRSYLNGIYLHEAGGALTGVATDGRRLARSALPVRECGGRWPTAGIIVPNKAVAIINKLIKTAETIELIVGAPAGASEPVTLISIRAGGRTLTSRLISGTFPSYQTIIPSCSNNWAKIGRATLIAAANRAAAVSTERGLCLGITWSRGDTTVQMCLTREPDSAVDEIPAELHGSARTALSASLLVEQLDAISGENVRLDTGNHPGTPVVITDPADPSFVSLLMPMTWLAPALEPVRTRATRS